MTEQQIKAEHDRLRPILFNGAPDWATHAVIDRLDGRWWLVNEKISVNIGQPNLHLGSHTKGWTCKHQPKTYLKGMDTLIDRGDL